MNKYNKKIKNSVSGFTLIEVIIVVSIMAIMMAITIGYNHSSNDKILLFSNQAKTIGVLQRAKSFALQKRANDEGKLICAVGVYFQEPRTMTIFQDFIDTADSFCDNDENNFNKEYDEGENEKIEEQKLDSTIEFDFPGDITFSTVIFEPPYLNVYGYGTITLKVTGSNATSGVVIKNGGQIYGN